MKKILKIINKIIIAGIICYLAYLAYFAYEIVRYGHSHDWETCKQYLWIFKEYVVRDLKSPQEDRFICSSYKKKHDVYNSFNYYHTNDMLLITVWEFKDLANIDLHQININRNVNLSNIKFISGEILHADSPGPITIKYGFAFHNGMNINLDNNSKIDGTFEGPNYKGFYGTIHKMSFSDEKGKHQIVFEHISNIFNHLTNQYNPSFSATVFLLYKGHNSFYVIIINSEKPFKDASIINILNLQ